MLRLREEFFDDMMVLEQHYIFECTYADYAKALSHRPADGVPGEINADHVAFENLAEMAQNLYHYGLINSDSQITLPSLLLEAIESLYLLRRGQKFQNEEMIRQALDKADAARRNELLFLNQRKVRVCSKSGRKSCFVHAC